MKFSLAKKRGSRSGFTLIELMVSLVIFAFMTAFLLAKYGNFNQGILLTNVAYDLALTIRSAQEYGINVQGVTTGSCTINSPCFYYPYGVHFGDPTPNNQFIFFADSDANHLYSSSIDTTINTYTLNPGYTIQSICSGTASNCTLDYSLDISFKRPNPDAIIMSNGAGSPQSYAKIILTAGVYKKSVVVQSTGQIAVTN